MKFDIQHISVKEHWKDWLYNAFQIYKAGILSHTAIYLVAFMVMFAITPSLSESMAGLFLLVYFIFIAPYFLVYMFGMLYKKDKNAPEFENVDFSFHTMKRIFKLQSIILTFLLSVSFVSMGFSQLGNTGAEASETSSNVLSEYNIYDYLGMAGSYTFKYSEFILYFSYFVLYVFCNRTLFQSLILFNDFLLEKKNFGVFAISLFAPAFIMGVIASLPSEFKILYIFITPFLTSWHYVVFKHGFFGMTPEKQEEREKVDNNAYHMT